MLAKMAILISACLLLAPPQAFARSVTGNAEIVDGDTLTVSGVKIRLFGIDAPEARQSCFKGAEAWSCGLEAGEALRSLIGGYDVTCDSHEVDQYGRLVATCRIGQADIGREMVAAGWATAFRSYSDRYVADEARAKAARLGIWGSTFDLPENFRNAGRPTANTAAPNSSQPRARSSAQQAAASSGRCAIKGNRNRKGQWIYHVPGMPYYDQTRPEEIFCTEAQAQAAGYRRAIVR